MKGIIINNAYFDTPATRYQSGRIKEELEKLGTETVIKKNDFFGAAIKDGKLENAVKGYDFCVYLDKDKYLSYALEKCGVRLFNSHAAIRVCDDKAETFLALANSGIPMPKTLAGLLCYTPDAVISPETYDKIERELGYPLIVKQCYGSLGKFVYKADGRKQLEEISEKLKCTPHLFQQFIKNSEGRDIRVTVIGGKAVAAMKRVSETDFRSNIELGGKGEKFEIDRELRGLCERVAQILKLDYCGIDVLFGESGYLLCEVNSNAFFGGIESAAGVNVAKLYAAHILSEVKK